MANITALTAARDCKLNDENLHLGVAYVSDQTHSSVAKGLSHYRYSKQSIPVCCKFELCISNGRDMLKEMIAKT